MTTESRYAILRRLRAETFGPSTGPWDRNALPVQSLKVPADAEKAQGKWGPMYAAETGDEFLHSTRAPKSLFGVGVLYPVALAQVPASGVLVEGGASDDSVEFEANSDTENAGEALGEESGGPISDEVEEQPRGPRAEEAAQAAQPAPRRRHVQSSIGLTFSAFLPKGTGIQALLPDSWRFPWMPEGEAPWRCNAVYKRANLLSSAGQPPQIRFHRCPIRETVAGSDLKFSATEFDSQQMGTMRRQVVGQGLSLEIELRFRQLSKRDEYVCTVTLINRSQSSATVDNLLFQSLLAVELIGEGARFVPYSDENAPALGADDDDLSLQILYREVSLWGIGHGCAAAWHTSGIDVPRCIWADVMPAVELPSMTADVRSRDGASLAVPMMHFADPTSDWSTLEVPLIQLASEYEAWIEAREGELSSIPWEPAHQRRASEHLSGCRDSLRRMRAGIALLQRDPIARESFRLANIAIALQQVAQRDVHPATRGQAGRVTPDACHAELLKKAWRPFQLGFVLSSIASICTTDSKDPDRNAVDLIWFPTGGGKTEAYLGLVAFSLFWNRMRHGVKGEGTIALMRYTLRMLTTQQFQRAASLIAAMEWLRQQQRESTSLYAQRTETKYSLGERRFSLGLWVGAKATPNTHSDAGKQLKRWEREGGDKPFPVVDCPWCRTRLERVEEGRNAVVLGFEMEAGHLLTHCPCRDCAFYEAIPIQFVDESIYETPPSLLIGTVDKFVQLAFKPEARSLLRGGPGVGRMRPPSLIIQDELHLITGPLGSLFGVFEMAVEELCVDEEGLRPKLVCSTATTRGAKKQVQQLFGRSDLSLFPPPGLSIGDSFFGQWARDSEGRLSPGRMYVGTMASNYPSQLITEIRVFSTLLLSGSADIEERDRDPWWTILAFFKSIRELSGAAMLCQFDIPEYLEKLNSKWGLAKEVRRWLRNHMELSGRLEAPEVIERMDRLSTRYQPTAPPPDICLATNIIEVGVDIPRLSLLVMDGPPGSAARYIQVSGRVGRDWERAPGLVITLYNAGKPRDMSHFEQFCGDHLRLYAAVEPNSVTPFSEDALDRHLHTAVVAWVRGVDGMTMPSFTKRVEELIKEFRNRVSERVGRASLDVEAKARALEGITRRLAEFETRWRAGNDLNKWVVWSAGSDLGLLLPAGTCFSDAQKRAGTRTMGTLRNVDGEAKLQVLPEGEEE